MSDLPSACRACGASVTVASRFCPSCGGPLIALQPSSSPGDPWIGKLVAGRFRVLEKLGAGGMGVVYKAEQVAMRRPVALKMLHPQLVQDTEVVTRFENEAAACSRLTHPNTITVHDFGQAEDGSLFIAMEFIPGRSLEAILHKEGALPWTRVVDIALQICGSLAEAHAVGIVHRDLKPGNIMLFDRPGRADSVKVLDFGIAKICQGTPGTDQRQALTRTGMVFGTPQYMSPEQIKGEKVGPRSDLYAVGVILYEMLTGDLPFSAETPMGLLTKHLLEVPRPIRDAFPGVAIPRSLEAAVMSAMAKEVAGRQGSMEDLARELEATLGDSPSMPPPPSVAIPLSSERVPARSAKIAVPAPTPMPTPGPTPATRVTPGSPTPVAGEVGSVPARRPARAAVVPILAILGLCGAAVGGWALMVDHAASRDDGPRDPSPVMPSPGLPVTPPAAGGLTRPHVPPQQGHVAPQLPVTPVVSVQRCTLQGAGAAADVARALEGVMGELRACLADGTVDLRWDVGGRPPAPRALAGVEGPAGDCALRVLGTLNQSAIEGQRVTVRLELGPERCSGQVQVGRPRPQGGRPGPGKGRGPKDQVLGGPASR